MLKRLQRTLRKNISFSGVGVHSGQEAVLELRPAPAGSGIVFHRHMPDGRVASIESVVSNVINSNRTTVLGVKDCSVSTVEHLLAALYACCIDNVDIIVSGPEVPILDGSSDEFCRSIMDVGSIEQDIQVDIITVDRPVFVQSGQSILIALPADEFRLSYTLKYDNNDAIGTQFFSLALSEKSFIEELAKARTFALYEEVKFLLDNGLIKGGCFDNAVVFSNSEAMNPGGLRFKDEPVRHKILDLIGDLSLSGSCLQMHVIAIGSGHYLNALLCKKLVEEYSIQRN